MYMQGFLPAIYQPSMFRAGPKPVLNLELPKGVSMEERRRTLQLLKGLNEANMTAGDLEFEARLSAHDLAFKMQVEALDIFDINRESCLPALSGARCALRHRSGRRWLWQHAVGRALRY